IIKFFVISSVKNGQNEVIKEVRSGDGEGGCF
ncbi:unnamed protein product, partial [Allacma fusca]